MRIFDERVILMRCDLPTIFDYEAQVQRIIFEIAQPELYTARVEVLIDCSKHFCGELFRCGFGRQDIEAAHHYFDVTACQLLGTAQCFLGTIPFNGKPCEVGCQFNQLQILRGRTAWFSVVNAERS
jgi:hypothetical protein